MRLGVGGSIRYVRRLVGSLARSRTLQCAGLPVLTQLTRLPMLGPWLHHPAGVLALAAKQPALAAVECTAALAAGRAWTGTIHRHLGKAQLALGQLDAAEQSLRRAVATASRDRSNRLWLAETLLRQDRAREAESLLRTLLAEGPDQPWPHLVLIAALLRLRRADAAFDHLIAAATRPGADVAAIPFPEYLLMPALATPTRAAALAPVVERHPGNRALATFQARLLAQIGDYTESTRLPRRASAGDPRGRDAASTGSRRPPAFLIIGQAKAGTTALFDWLTRHPDIEAPLIKEIQYWSRFPDAGLDWYLAHFPVMPADVGEISGEASTTYLTCPTTAAAIARDLPDVRLICLLREPVARAYSEYRMFQRLGWEQRPWDDVVAAELDALGDCPLTVAALDAQLARVRPGYLPRSAALPYLMRWSALFPSERLLILHNAELFSDPAATVNRVFRYLGLAEHRIGSVAPVNKGYYPPMAPALARRLRDWFAPHQQVLAAFLRRTNS